MSACSTAQIGVGDPADWLPRLQRREEAIRGREDLKGTVLGVSDVVEPEDLEVAALASSWQRGTFAAMAVAAYRQLWLGNVLSFVAIQMQAVARGWLALEFTGSSAGLGGVFLAFGVPMLVVTPFAGVAADRLPKRRLLLAAQVAMAASGALLTVAIVADVAAYWMLVAAGGVQGLDIPRR